MREADGGVVLPLPPGVIDCTCKQGQVDAVPDGHVVVVVEFLGVTYEWGGGRIRKGMSMCDRRGC